MPAPARIAVVGATGRVRRHAVSVLERTGLPVEATSRSTDGAGLAVPGLHSTSGSAPSHSTHCRPCRELAGGVGS